MNHDWGEVVTR